MTCGGGMQDRTRSIAVDSAFGGRACGQTSETRECNTAHCPVDCNVNAYGLWTPCSATCGGGSHMRSRSITNVAAYGGKACPPLDETETCNTAACPVDCMMTAWENWSECSMSCGVGSQSRSRSVTTPATFGGVACGELTQDQGCSDGQALPPKAAGRPMLRARVLSPLPQLLLHAVHASNANTTQSTGQPWVLQARVSLNAPHVPPN